MTKAYVVYYENSADDTEPSFGLNYYSAELDLLSNPIGMLSIVYWGLYP
jgi:hypothetical protein